jgi:hypothetical protein
MAVRFSDRALPAVRSAFWPYSRGPNRPFPNSPQTLAFSTDLWACFERDPVVSGPGYVVLGLCGQHTEWRGGSTGILLARQGQNRLFTCHLLLGDCGEDGSGTAWRSALRRRVHALPVMESPLRGHGQRERQGRPIAATHSCAFFSPVLLFLSQP